MSVTIIDEVQAATLRVCTKCKALSFREGECIECHRLSIALAPLIAALKELTDGR